MIKNNDFSDKDKINKLVRKKNNLESGLEPDGNKDSAKIIAQWKSFMKFPIPEQTRIRVEWDKYYSEVKESPIYALVMEQRNAASKNNWIRVIDLAEQAKQMKLDGNHTTIPKPLFPDPWDFSFGYVRDYISLERRIIELSGQVNVYSAQTAKDAFAK
jgi:hypothetical protein